MWNGRPHEHERAPEVDADKGIEVLDGHFVGDGRLRVDPGVVDDDVEAAEPVRGLLYEPIDLFRDRHVAAIGQELSSHSLHVLPRLFEFLRPAADAGNLGPFSSKPDRR
jgi:hypothetical protein